MIGKFLGAVLWVIGIAVISMMAVPPQDNATAQIMVWLLWFGTGSTMTYAFSSR